MHYERQGTNFVADERGHPTSRAIRKYGRELYIKCSNFPWVLQLPNRSDRRIHIRNFLLYLIKEKKVLPSTVNIYSAAIRFLFAVTLNRTLNYLQIPRQKKRKTFPEILTREEVSAIIESCQNIKHKAMLMVVYSSGLRVSEAARLKIQHIDSKSMHLFVDMVKVAKIVILYSQKFA